MNKRGFSKLFAFCAALALTLIPVFSVSKADGQTDLKADAQTVVTYLDDLGKLGRTLSDLSKKESLSRDEFNKARGDADALKRRLSDVERAVAAMIKKLKDNNNWDNFDDLISKTLTDSKAQELLRKCGGARKCLEAASRLTSNASEIDQLLEPIRSKGQARSGGDYLYDERSGFGALTVPALYSPTPVLSSDSFACKASRAVMVATGTHKSINRAYCLCVEMPVLQGETLGQCMDGLS